MQQLFSMSLIEDYTHLYSFFRKMKAGNGTKTYEINNLVETRITTTKKILNTFFEDYKKQ